MEYFGLRHKPDTGYLGPMQFLNKALRPFCINGAKKAGEMENKDINYKRVDKKSCVKNMTLIAPVSQAHVSLFFACTSLLYL